MSFGVIYDTDFNQNNPKLISSDVNGTFYTTFPTTTTGDSQGNYNRLGIDGQSNNRWDFLNISGLLTGGFNWWNSSNTQAPKLLGTLDDTGLTIDRSTTTNNTNYNTYDTIITGPNYIVMAHNPSGDPEHWVLQQMYIIQVGNNTSTMSTGVNYNVKYADTQLVTVHTTSDPNSPIIDSTGITSVLIPDGSIPIVITKVSLLTGDTLSIKNDPDYDATSLSDTGLTLTNSDATNIHITASSFNLNGNAKTVSIDENSLIVSDSIVSTTVNNFSIGINDGISSSLLNSTNLTFGGRSYAQNQVVPTLIYSSPGIYADGHVPDSNLTIRNSFGYSGWYFKNAPPNTSPTNKINWYFPPANRNITTVGDLKGIAISFFNGNTTSNDNTLFLTVLTVPTGSNDYFPGFYHSSNTYVFNKSITPVANTNYQGVAIIDKSFVPFNFETQIQFQPSTVNNPKGTYSQTDNVLAVVIGTNSASTTNSVELVVNKINLIYSNFTQSYLLIPP